MFFMVLYGLQEVHIMHKSSEMGGRISLWAGDNQGGGKVSWRR